MSNQIREAALREAAEIAYRTCAETRHVSLGDKTRNAILARIDAELAKHEGSQ